jgi:hypothetical protein
LRSPPFTLLSADSTSDLAGGTTRSIHADVGCALADGLSRALVAGDLVAARRILAALSALIAEDSPEAALAGEARSEPKGEHSAG